MTTLLHESIPKLAWGPDGDPFQPPEGTVAWRVREDTKKPGRPPAIWGEHGVLHIGLDADMAQLRRALNGRTGSFRLYPVDFAGNELEPVAVVEVVPLDHPGDARASPLFASEGAIAIEAEAARAHAQIPLRFFDLYERMQTSRDAHDSLLAGLLTTLVSNTSTIQESTAGLLQTANETVRIANGVDAMERAETAQSDIEAITEQLALVGKLKDTLGTLADDQEPTPPWFVQLLNGPVGMGLMSFANNFAQAAAKAQAQGAQTDEEK